MPEISWYQIVRMIAAIHVNDAVGHGVSDSKNVDALQFRYVHNFKPVRRHDLSWPRCGLATGIRFAGQVGWSGAMVCECPGPRLQRDIIDMNRGDLRRYGLIVIRVDDNILGTSRPGADTARRWAEIDAAIFMPRRRP